MDDSFLTKLGSQSSLWKMAGNLSSILDGTMPDLLETTMNETQPFASTFLDISRIETEEFVRNEAVCATIADIIELVENDVSQHEERFRRPLDLKVDDFNNDSEDGDFESKCTKRIMNESIMSIGDPMTTESKKQKNQLDGSLMECFHENNENTMQISVNFSLCDLIQEMEDKENLDPKSPSTSGDQLSSFQPFSNKAPALIEFNSPDENLFPDVTVPTIQSPKRPVFTELNSDLFGIIFPDNTHESNFPTNTKASDLLSVSIFQTSPNNNSIDSTGLPFNQSTKRLSLVPEPTTDADKSLKESCSANNSIYSTSLLFNQSAHPNNRVSAHETSVDEKAEGSAESSVISLNLFDLSVNGSQVNVSTLKDNSMHVSIVSNNMATTEIEPSGSFTYDNFENEVKDRIQEMSFVEDDTSQPPPPTLPEDEQTKADNVDSGASSLIQEDICPSMADESLLETKLVYESKIVELNARIEELEELAKQSQKSVLEEPQLIEEEAFPNQDEVTFSMEDRVNLIKTKLDYENMIVDLKERIDDLEAEVDASRAQTEPALPEAVISKKEFANAEMQTSMIQEADATIEEVTFSMEDRVNLIETKLAYENEIVDLRERVEELQIEVDTSRAQLESQISLKKEVTCAEMQTSMIQEADATIEEVTFSMEDRLNLIETKLAYETEIVNLRERVEQLQAEIGSVQEKFEDDMAKYRYKYELTLVPEHQSLKEHYQILANTQLETREENQKLLETISEMDEQRNNFRKDVVILTERIATLTDIKDQVQEKLEACQAELNKLTVAQQTANSEHQSALTTFNQQIAILRESLCSLEDESAQLKKENIRLQETVTLKDNSLKSLEKSCSENEAKLADFERSIMTLRSEMDFSENRVTELVEELQAVNMLSEKYVNENTDLIEEQGNMKQANEALQAKVADLQASISSLEKSNAELESKLKSESTKSNELGHKLQHAEEEHSRVERTVISLQSCIRILETEKVSLTESVKHVEDQLAVAIEGKTSLSQELKNYREQINKMQATVIRAENLNHSLKALPVKEKLSDSVKANQKLIASINKLIEQIKTDKVYKESVKTELVKKILCTIREKLNVMVVDHSKVLGQVTKEETNM